MIDVDGKQLGILPLQEALRKSRDKGLDLIQVTEKVDPPVCKLGDFGKYLYHEKKKEKRSSTVDLKNIRLTYNISEHDTQTRMKSAVKFLQKGHPLRIELVLRGRQKGMTDFARDKLNRFLEQLKESVPFKVQRELKRQGRGLTIIISKI